jgi:hypothetical protein
MAGQPDAPACGQDPAVYNSPDSVSNRGETVYRLRAAPACGFTPLSRADEGVLGGQDRGSGGRIGGAGRLSLFNVIVTKD